MYEEENRTLTNESLTEAEKDEIRKEIRMNEDDLISGLLAAAAYTSDETQTIEIRRKVRESEESRLFFRFSIHPISEEMLNDIRKKYTKYTKNRRQGIRVAEELDTPKYRASIIYNSTVKEDRDRLWDNPKIHKALENQGKVIVTPLDVIEAVLLPGEKDRVMDLIDEINGYNNEDMKVDTAKN